MNGCTFSLKMDPISLGERMWAAMLADDIETLFGHIRRPVQRPIPPRPKEESKNYAALEQKVQEWILRAKTDPEWVNSLFINYPCLDDAGVAPKELYIIAHAVWIALNGKDHIEFLREKLSQFVKLPYPTDVIAWLSQIRQKHFVYVGL
jgi:hypothetical protein